MSDDPDSGLVELPEIRAAFRVFVCRDLSEAYLLRDRTAAYATVELENGRGSDALVRLEAVLRATLGLAIVNDLPLGDTVRYAGMWRFKLRTLARQGGSPSGDSWSHDTGALSVTFSLHRYSIDSLLDAVAIALTLPSQRRVDVSTVHVPGRLDVNALIQRRLRFNAGIYGTTLPGTSRVPPRLDSTPSSVIQSEPKPAEPPAIPKSLALKVDEGLSRGSIQITLDTQELDLLRKDELFSKNPDLIRDGKFKVDELVKAMHLSPDPPKTGVAAELHQMLTRETK